jgi:hypothetical protein
MAQTPFGNIPVKVEKYLSFWNRDDVTRPHVGMQNLNTISFYNLKGSI